MAVAPQSVVASWALRHLVDLGTTSPARRRRRAGPRAARGRGRWVRGALLRDQLGGGGA